MAKQNHFKKALLPSLISALLVISPSALVFAEEVNESKANTEKSEKDKAHEDETKVKALERIVIVGSKSQQALGDIAGSVSVMSADDIVGQAVSGMADLFKNEPGIEISGSAGTAQNFTIRGMGADRVMMVKDGMRMNEGFGANGANDIVGRGFIDVDTVKQVEVAKGASSSLFGADALGGVVVFTTKDPSDYLGDEDFSFDVNASYDQRSDLASSGFVTAASFGELEAMVSYKKRSGEQEKNYDENNRPLEIDGDSILFKTVYNMGHHQKLSFTVDYYSQDVASPDRGAQERTWLGLPGFNITGQYSDSAQENISYSLKYAISNADSMLFDNMNLNLYSNNTEQQDQQVINLDVDGMFGTFLRDQFDNNTFIQDTVGFSAALFKLVKVGDVKHGISYGFDYDTSATERTAQNIRIQDGEETRNEIVSPFPENDTTRMGIYIQDQIEIGNWQIVPGLRFDDYEMEPNNSDPLYLETAGEDAVVEAFSEGHVSPRIGAIYKMNDNINVYGQFSTGFKVPPYDLAYVSRVEVMLGYGLEAATDLEPEESESIEFGLRGHGDNFEYSVAVYQNDYDNMIEIAYTKTEMFYGFFPVNFFQYQNIESATIKGVELSAKYWVGKQWAVFANATSMNAKDNQTDDYLNSMRPVSGTIGISYNNNDDLSVNIVTSLASAMHKVNYADRDGDEATPDTGTRTTAGYGSVDIMANYEINESMKINFSVFNLLDKDYTKYASVSGVPANDGRDYGLFSEPGRGVSIRLDYSF